MRSSKKNTVSVLHYLQNIAEVADVVGAQISEQILGSQDHVIVNAGQRIDHSIVEKVKTNQLNFDELKISMTLTMERWRLRQQFADMLARFPDIRRVHQHMGFEADFKSLLGRLKITKPLAQALAVMSVRRPLLMRQSIMGAWFAGLISRQMGLSRELQDASFQGALYRDLGMLYVDPFIMEEGASTEFGPSEWKQLQSHVEVSSDLLNKHLEDPSEELASAVAMHHERADGSGYPRALKGEHIPIFCQIVAFSDVVSAVRIKRFKDTKRTIRDVVNVTLLNMDGFDNSIGDAFWNIVNGIQLEAVTFDDVERQRVLGILVNRAKQIHGDMRKLNEAMSGRFVKKPQNQLYTTVKNTLNNLIRSGHGDPELGWWLGLVASGRDELDEGSMAEIELQQAEILRQLDRLQRDLEESAPISGKNYRERWKR